MRPIRVAILGRYPIELLMERGYSGTASPLSSFITVTDGLEKSPDVEPHVVLCGESIPRNTSIIRGRTTFHLLRGLSERNCALTLHQVNAGRIHALLREIRPDIVHGDHSGLYAYAAVTSKYPNVITLRGIFGEIKKVVPRKHILTRWHLLSFLEELTVKKAANIISISPYVASLIAKKFRGAIFSVENPVEDAFLEPIMPTSGPSGQILFVGTLYPLKGVIDLLSAFERVCGALPNLRLLVAGPPHPAYAGYHRDLLAFVDMHDLRDRVEFIGFTHRGELRRRLDESLCLVLPSYQETAPMVIAEAMARGVPVIATRVGGIPYMIKDREEGILVAPGDIAGLAEAFVKLHTDATLRTKLSNSCRVQAETRFRSELIIQQTVAVYKTILHLQ